ncbi:MAG TPA: phosphoribosylamine--glycine ligase [Azospirillaceae bacterium]|nr:phosphoribosylamine--glycine ligase [Azospirillaceae bacterium]
MRILVVGGGGREHALCWAIAASPLCDKLFCAPGNAGIAEVAECVPVKADDIDGLVDFAREGRIDFVVVGPEVPLVAGLADRLQDAGIGVFGPSAAAARIEGSKAFMKEICLKAGVATARHRTFDNADAARAYVRGNGAPIVVKADGLAAGKGVVVAQTVEEAEAAITAMLEDKRFGASGGRVVVEEFLAGEEASFFALVDGTTALPLASARDYKRVGDGDTGPNTGGMGAVSPHPAFTPDLEARVMREVVEPVVRAMAEAGAPYKGVLYAGLMLVPGPDGLKPYVIEFNARFGDPETQVLMPRVKGDLLPLLMAASDAALHTVSARWHDRSAVTVVMAAEGYPDTPRTGTEIRGLDRAAQVAGAVVFHAATKVEGGAFIATGGRVLTVTATGANVAEARATAYRAVDAIDWPGGFCRRDIAANFAGSKP